MWSRDAVQRYLSGQLPETIVTIFHANVAQKSYGSEKRFLCPPPMVSVIGRVPAERVHMRMSIVDENNVRGVGASVTARVQPRVSVPKRFPCVCVWHEKGWPGAAPAEHKASVDEFGRNTFKHMHVTDLSHARRFNLTLRLAPTVESTAGPTFDSRPINIISKPSKKTSKARSTSRTWRGAPQPCRV